MGFKGVHGKRSGFCIGYWKGQYYQEIIIISFTHQRSHTLVSYVSLHTVPETLKFEIFKNKRFILIFTFHQMTHFLTEPNSKDLEIHGLDFTEVIIFVFDRVENIVEKGQNTGSSKCCFPLRCLRCLRQTIRDKHLFFNWTQGRPSPSKTLWHLS